MVQAMAQAVSHHPLPLHAQFSFRPNRHCSGDTGTEAGGAQ